MDSVAESERDADFDSDAVSEMEWLAENEDVSVADCECDSEALAEAVVDGVSDAVRLLDSLRECDVVSDGEAD